MAFTECDGAGRQVRNRRRVNMQSTDGRLLGGSTGFQPVLHGQDGRATRELRIRLYE
jgi:hypothetical protein